MKKRIFLIASLVFILIVNLGVSGAAATFDFNVTSQKSSYESGESIKINFYLTNKTSEEIENIVVIAELEDNDTCLYGDIGSIAFASAEPGDRIIGEFNYYENDTILKAYLALGASGLLGGLILFFTRRYAPFMAVITTVTLVFTSAFSSFPVNLHHLTALRTSEELGTYTVSYDSKEQRFNFRATYETVKDSHKYSATKTAQADTSSVITSQIKENGSAFGGVIFGASISDGDFCGYMMYIRPDSNTAGIMKKDSTGYTTLASKKVTLESGKAYAVKICTDGVTAKCRLYSNPLDVDPFPLFDIPVSLEGTDVGIFGSDSAEISTPEISAYTPEDIGESYTNSILPDIADPYILTYEGTYYLYATNGFRVYTSTDLVSWTDRGCAADKKDLYGTSDYWAPEVYYHNGLFYLFYTADQKIAIATSESPLGPFKKAMDGYLFDFEGIDANLFFDDDGRIYCYVSRNRRSENLDQPIWVAEMNDDLLSYKPETLTQVCTPEGGWEYDVNEGPFMIKHNGTYYLTYSGERYDMLGYSVGYLTSESPLGPFTRYENNPILKADAFVHGPGHHCFVYSPDGSELFIAYHSHYSTQRWNNRKLCIDRVKFVPTTNGADILTVYGPTVTAQPIPK